MSDVLVPWDRPLLEGTFERRYKRFFVDVRLADGERVTAHTPNTGSMMGLLEPGARALVTYDPSPKRRLHYTLQAIRIGSTWVGTNTMLPNRLVERAIAAGRIRELCGYRTIRREVQTASRSGSRVDLLLDDHRAGRPPCLVEVKNVTLREGRRALFPDAVTERGLRHLEELMAFVREGGRAAMVFVAQRLDCDAFAPAHRIDPAYAEGLLAARAAGVQVEAILGSVEKEGVRFAGRLRTELSRSLQGAG